MLLCARLKPIYLGDSSVYQCEGSYYLLLKRMDDVENNPAKIEMILSEYGDRVLNVSFFEGYLNEYGTLMVEKNAIGYFGDLL